VTGDSVPADSNESEQSGPSGFMGWLTIGKGFSSQIEAVEYKRQLTEARIEFVYLSQALEESGKFEATLTEVLKLYRVYLAGVLADDQARAKWRELPPGLKPRSKKTAKNLPSKRAEFRKAYTKAQGLLEVIKSEGFDPIQWAKANPGPVGTKRGLAGPEGLTYFHHAPGKTE